MRSYCTCRAFVLDDVPRLLHEVAARTDLRVASEHLIVTDLREQQVRHVIPVFSTRGEDWYDVRLRVADLAAPIIGERSPGPPTQVTHLLRCHEGRAFPRSTDTTWVRIMRHGLQLLDTYEGSVLSITPHGWISDERDMGLAPTLDELHRRRLSVVT